MKNGLIFGAALAIGLVAFGQSSRQSFESSNLYWKQRMPFPGYWQQDVHYQIRASLNDSTEIIRGTVELEYVNNSPYALNELFFHVYQNLFEPNSYGAHYHNMNVTDTPAVYQHTDVHRMTINGQEVEIFKDNTILRVQLSEPIESGSTTIISYDFTTQFGPQNLRMKVYSEFGQKHFNVAHWYPRLSVFDRKFGWTTDQHLGNEFYGDFGTFEVDITLPAHYILDATGVLQNENEVLPEDLKGKLDLTRFADKPWNEKPSTVIEPTDKTKTWRYKAEHVHDFAWTADPAYRIGRATAKLSSGRTIECIALAQEQHASGWQNAAEYCAKVIEVYSRDIGEYEYPKMIVADADDGMEYPMLTLDGGRDPDYRGLIAHEVGHNWFYGMVGNNETYRAALDEGFTQFLTAWSLISIEGPDAQLDVPKGWMNYFHRPRSVRDEAVYDGYYNSAVIWDDDPSLNTHSDQFEKSWQYGQVYNKTAVMLYNLEYVLGDSLFLTAMQHYFNQWKFAHPYVEDFRNSIISFTGVDLNWFFDQWLETDKKVDYAIAALKKQGKGHYELKLKRKGEMQMPVEITLTDSEGKNHQYIVPNNWFVKSTDATVLPKWTGWGEFNRTYTAEIKLDAEITRAAIDPSERLADVYHLDNRIPFPVSVRFDDMRWSKPTRSYDVEWRPSLWYNGFDGLKVGVAVKSSYAAVFHRMDVGVWLSTGLGEQPSTWPPLNGLGDFDRIQYRFSYSTPLRQFDKSLKIHARSRWVEGLAANTLGFSKSFLNDKTYFTWRLGSLWRPNANSQNYLLYPSLWNIDRVNNYSGVRINHVYSYGKSSEGHIVSHFRSSLLSHYNYGYINLEAVNDNRLSFLNFKTRTFAQWGAGDNWAPESMLYAAGANPEEMMEGSLIRSVGYMPTSLYGYGASVGNFQSGGGLGLRGYNNYILPEYNKDSLLRFVLAGSSGLAFNSEIELGDVMHVMKGASAYLSLVPYVFGDAGVININRVNESFELSNIRADAGAGVAFTVKQWGPFNNLEPLTIRADFPLFLNRPPADEDYVQFRWLIGFDRAF